MLRPLMGFVEAQSPVGRSPLRGFLCSGASVKRRGLRDDHRQKGASQKRHYIGSAFLEWCSAPSVLLLDSSFPSCTWERTCLGNSVSSPERSPRARPDVVTF